MTQKKTASSKRAKKPRSVAYTKTFDKDWNSYNRAGKYDMHNAVAVMDLIFKNQPIPEQYCDHELKGEDWGGARELHIGGDFLLVYRVDDAKNLVTFVRLGTHSELFG
ncbi:type II toxin-antitoxin system YafQ family toxin [Vibrio cholerae]|nr:type II toxin-antitoxin system YafQ family toxin [Vibrio cholerae]